MRQQIIYDLKNVTKRYADRTVLDIASLQIESGELFAIVGPSGAGKSTLLRILDYLEAPNSGSVAYAGKVFVPPIPIDLRREIGMLFQRPELLSRSVRDNVIFPMKLRGQEDNGEAELLIEQLALNPLTNTSAMTLSGGELQRVALARVLVTQPKVLLLDEPTANLDPYHVDLIESMVRKLHKQGVTIVLVTHNVFQARRLADRVGLILKGEFVEIKPTVEFFENPEDPRSIEFVQGKMVY